MFQKISQVSTSFQSQGIAMGIGFKTHPRLFHRTLDLIRTRFKWKTFLVYMYYRIIFSKDIDEHIHPVDEILTTLGEARVTLKLKKCLFFSTCLEYLGHIINPGRLSIDQTHMKCSKAAKPPTNQSARRLFLVL